MTVRHTVGAGQGRRIECSRLEMRRPSFLLDDPCVFDDAGHDPCIVASRKSLNQLSLVVIGDNYTKPIPR